MISIMKLKKNDKTADSEKKTRRCWVGFLLIIQVKSKWDLFVERGAEQTCTRLAIHGLCAALNNLSIHDMISFFHFLSLCVRLSLSLFLFLSLCLALSLSHSL